MPAKTILILGGGVGGMIAANALRTRLPKEHRIILIERNADHAFAPSFLWVMTGDRKPERVRRPLTVLLRPGINVVHASAEGLDLHARQVVTTGGAFPFDYLIVALGAELAPELVPGVAEGAHTFYTLDGAVRLHEALRTFSGERIAVVVAAMPYKCPGAPHEGAMLIRDYFQRRGLSDKVEVHLYTPETQPMPVAGPELGKAVLQMLQAKSIQFHPGHKLVAVDPTAKSARFQQGTADNCDLLVVIPPHRAPRLVREAGLTNAGGWIPVTPSTLETTHDGVFAVGDVTAIPVPGRWKPDVPLMLPKAGVFAHVHAEVVASRIAAQVQGRKPDQTFCGDGYCMLEAGEDLAGFAYGNFFAEPSPEVKLRRIGKAWHVGKVLLEKWWLSAPGWRRDLYGLALNAGSRAYGIPVSV
ncbi:MAG TPA: FAD/NAD(P)-binding oxidoreductase [Candidatus Acidoferrales bacterium]|nr:FAD/NAD(P)-binding oxidoreductase [Candidatus Acidoferrales bacterium]